MKSMPTVAVVLAVGISSALNMMTLAALWVAIAPHDPNLVPRLGENASQVLLSWGGGIIGVLGAYVGYLMGRREMYVKLEEDKPT